MSGLIRKMTGFLVTLTGEQRRMALEYRGPDTHGAVECDAYACHDGWVEGMGAGFECETCKGTGFLPSPPSTIDKET